MPRARYNFQPATQHYGKDVVLLDEDGLNPKEIGKLEEIRSPHCFLVGGTEYEVDSSDDFFPDDDGKVYLLAAW